MVVHLCAPWLLQRSQPLPRALPHTTLSPRQPHPAHLQPVIAQDRVQAVLAVLELPATDHVDGVESLPQAEEAAW